MINENNVNLAWPPEFKIKKHRRAKHVKLRASKTKGLEITVPYRFNIKEIPAILEENKNWITKQLLKAQLYQVDVLPDSVTFESINETWQIHYMPSTLRLKLFERTMNEVVVVGNIEDKARCKRLLAKWFKHKAQSFLSSELKKVSEATQLSFEKLTIRDQQTLWGSCTSKKNISLNYKLIFLPVHLVRHIMIHELSHTKHLNHSDRFWNLVATHDVDWRQNRSEMRRADKFIPMWL